MTTILNGNPGFTRFMICFVLIALNAGCTTMRPVYGTDAATYSAQIEVGDKIEITRNDLTTVEFKVTGMSDDGISGDDIFVAYDDIQAIQTVRNNTGTVLGVFALGALLFLVAGRPSAGLGFQGHIFY